MKREDIILPLVRGKRVLDIGSVGQSDVYCLWDALAAESRSLIGVDLPGAEDTAQTLLGVDRSGLDHAADSRVVRANMETVDLGRSFDVVVAGDVIEHVSNQGLFLENIRSHLATGGRLVITTPNAKWPTVALRPNLTHVLWHDRFTLHQLLTRHGFRVERLLFYQGNKPRYPLWAYPLLLRQQILVIASVTDA